MSNAFKQLLEIDDEHQLIRDSKATAEVADGISGKAMHRGRAKEHQGITVELVFCPFFGRADSAVSAILCQTCERGVRYAAKHFGGRIQLANYMHGVCYCTDYAQKCAHAAMMNNYYGGGNYDHG